MRYEDANWQKAMRLKVDYNNMLAGYSKAAAAITPQEIAALKDKAAEAFQFIAQNRGKGTMEWSELPYNQDAVVADILQEAKAIREKCDTFVVLGIGGSALGPIAVQQALNHLNYNELPAEKRGGPRIYVLDNIDPERISGILDIIDPKKTVFNVITKSGSTSETMSQYLIFREILKGALGEDYAGHIVATTDAENGYLVKIAAQEGFKAFVIPAGVGGRFSEMCPVGLLAAAVAGIDIREMLAGAAAMDKIASNTDIMQNPACLGGLLQYIAMQKGMNITVMMPYADSLRYMADWYAQLWAESLGKQYALDGKTEVFTGQTPVKALGVTDQHSQVQLYTEGPFDKVITFLAVEKFRCDVTIPHGHEDIPAVGFLGGHTMAELLEAEMNATEYALYKAKRLSCKVTLPEVNAFTIGELLYFFEMQVSFVGALLGIDTFNQPGVEEGKVATYALLGRPGFEEKKAELDARPAKDPAFILE
ncbi:MULTISPECIES: glucose-6-phosphate isomerase [unclassified Clostridium]|uniref:glucose-6-phosphate isomerase n=1 Tax=unclassified Clostridium TaxID=2614128 RepID=UPI001A9C1C19|nr:MULTISPECIES: glucose-6-phosphate isomerase [unclassified Clostridium]